MVGNTIRRFATRGKTKSYNVSSDPISLGNPFSKRINRKAGLDPHSLGDFVIQGGKAQNDPIIRKFNLFNFAKPLLKVADLLELDNTSKQSVIELKGSQTNPVISLYASDYDFFQQLTQKDIPMFVPHLIHLVELLSSKGSPIRPVELKLGGKNYKPTVKNLKRLEPRIQSIISKDAFAKLDLIMFDGKYYQEITVVYLFEPLANPKEIQTELLKESKEYRKQGMRYKASKRVIQSNKGTLKQRRSALKTLENPKLSQINRTANHLEAFLRFPNAKRTSLQWIKQDLSNVLNHKQQAEVSKLLNKGTKANGKKVMDLLKQWKLR